MTDAPDDAGVCPVCGTDWYRVLTHDETMKREDINYCPMDGEKL